MDFRQSITSSIVVAISSVLIAILGVAGTKYVAYSLGPEGVGLQSVYGSLMAASVAIFGLSIANSGTQYLAQSNAESVIARNSALESISLISKWTGYFGILCIATFAYSLSSIGLLESLDHTVLLWLACGIPFAVYVAGYQARLNGLKLILELARYRILLACGSLLVLIIAVATFGRNGLKASLLAPWLFGWVLGWRATKDLAVPGIGSDKNRVFSSTKKILQLGFTLSLGAIATQGTLLIVRFYLESVGGLVVVGHFQAAWLIAVTYVGFLLTAIIAEYYPRLSAVQSNEKEVCRQINMQISATLIIAAPLIVTGIATASLLIEKLYTTEFSISADLLQYLMIGDALKIFSWVVAIGLLVKEKKTLFLSAEIIWNILFLAIIYFLYTKFGLVTCGIAYIVGYLFYTLVVVIYAKYSFDLTINRRNWALLVAILSLSLVMYVSSQFDWEIAQIALTILVWLYCGRWLYSIFVSDKLRNMRE